ncbi:MAG: hypothetical protein GY827_04890 [Cytophagales bacterium]|nr:hypothetical protein [Cytophagales bacterium]
MKGDELRKLMLKGKVFVEYNGLNWEVIRKYRHKVWIKRGDEKKSLMFNKIKFVFLKEGESSYENCQKLKYKKSDRVKSDWNNI